MTDLQAIVAPILARLGDRNHWAFEPGAADTMVRAQALRDRPGLRPAAEDPVPTALLIVDAQNDFCYPEGALFVAGRSGDGARGDLERIAAWGYRNLDRLTTVAATMDEHALHQVFHPVFWLTAEGQPPPPYTTVSLDAFRDRRIVLNSMVHGLVPADRIDRRPPAEWAERQAEYYLARLANDARYDLTIWPFHCLKGGSGQNLAGIVREMMMFHAFARGAPPVLIAKGDNVWTESYSAVGPEVGAAFDGTPLNDLSAARPQATVAHVMRRHRRIVVAGQALSHCVLWTLSDMVKLIERGVVDPAPTIYVLTDACSPVVARDASGAVAVDYTDATMTVLAELAARPYLELVTTADDVSSWPGWGE